jgi:hypothetical protein
MENSNDSTLTVLKGYRTIHYNKELWGQQGTGAIGCIVSIIILLLVLYAIFQFSRPYIKRSMMESKLNNLAEWSMENPHYDDEFIIKAILNVAKEFSLDLIPENITLERTKEGISISVYWEDDINLPVYHKHLEFEVEITKQAPREKT